MKNHRAYLDESGKSHKIGVNLDSFTKMGKIFIFSYFSQREGVSGGHRHPFPIADHRSGSGVFPLANVKSAIFLATIIAIAYLCGIVGNAMGTPMAPHARP